MNSNMTTKPQDQRDIEAREALKMALRKAFQFGQTYWMQADSESYSENRQADVTYQKYDAFVIETLEALARPAPEALGAAKGELSDAEIVAIYREYYFEVGEEDERDPGHIIPFVRAILAKAKGGQS